MRIFLNYRALSLVAALSVFLTSGLIYAAVRVVTSTLEHKQVATSRQNARYAPRVRTSMSLQQGPQTPNSSNDEGLSAEAKFADEVPGMSPGHNSLPALLDGPSASQPEPPTNSEELRHVAHGIDRLYVALSRVPLTGPLKTGHLSEGALLYIEATDKYSTDAWILYSIDNAPYTAYSQPLHVNKPGSYTIKIKTTDHTRYTGVQTITLTIDRTR